MSTYTIDDEYIEFDNQEGMMDLSTWDDMEMTPDQTHELEELLEDYDLLYY